jgi:hypothetical protein
MKTTVDQHQIKLRESKIEKTKIELQKMKLQNLVNDFQDNGIEYNKVKQTIKGEVEYILTDNRKLLRIAIQSVVELLRLDPQKFHSCYYNQSTIQPDNDEEPILVEAEQLYKKMLENITNNVVINLNENNSSISSSQQKESSERTLSDPEDKGLERNLFKERPDVQAGHRMISYPNYGQAFHPNFDAEV